jgi:hypothetical protein
MLDMVGHVPHQQVRSARSRVSCWTSAGVAQWQSANRAPPMPQRDAVPPASLSRGRSRALPYRFAQGRSARRMKSRSAYFATTVVGRHRLSARRPANGSCRHIPEPPFAAAVDYGSKAASAGPSGPANEFTPLAGHIPARPISLAACPRGRPFEQASCWQSAPRPMFKTTGTGLANVTDEQQQPPPQPLPIEQTPSGLPLVCRANTR